MLVSEISVFKNDLSAQKHYEVKPKTMAAEGFGQQNVSVQEHSDRNSKPIVSIRSLVDRIFNNNSITKTVNYYA